MPIATGGTIRVTRVEKTKTCPARLLNRVIAYAAGTASTTVSRVLITAVVTLLMNDGTTPKVDSAAW